MDDLAQKLRGLRFRVCGQAADRIEADAKRIAELEEIGDKMASSIEGNYYLPGIATKWRKARAALGEKKDGG